MQCVLCGIPTCQGFSAGNLKWHRNALEWGSGQGCFTRDRGDQGGGGMHQGTALSPFSFAMVIDWLTEEVRLETPRIMMFADDVEIFSGGKSREAEG